MFLFLVFVLSVAISGMLGRCVPQSAQTAGHSFGISPAFQRAGICLTTLSNRKQENVLFGHAAVLMTDMEKSAPERKR
jgi:hypothetical protein